MFLTDCPTCGRRELRGARSIETLLTTERAWPSSTGATTARQ